MKKKLLSILLALMIVVGLLPTAALAASPTEEGALGEVDIYNGGDELRYLSINGRVQEFLYTYYNFNSKDGTVKEIPAYCVNPNLYGVPQTVPKGHSIKYLASEKASDPKIMGIVANGYPTRGLYELQLDDKEQAYYATKIALWCYILPNWNISNLKLNPALGENEKATAEKILRAAKDIYSRGTAWDKVYEPNFSVVADRAVAYPVTIDGRSYKQQIFTVTSETWICNYAVQVGFSDPSEVPSGTRIVDMDNRDITTITTAILNNKFGGQFKVLYPADSVAGKTGTVQLSLHTQVYNYGIYYAVCQEKSKYGNLQNYMCDTDPTTDVETNGLSSYSDTSTVITEEQTGLKIIKLETGTNLPLSGAQFEVVDPNGATVGVFSTNYDGQILLPLDLIGNYTVYERQPAPNHKFGAVTVQNVDVAYGKIATLTFYNDPYGTLRVQKLSNTGEYLRGVTIQVKNIQTGDVYSEKTGAAGVANFEVAPGAYEVREIAGITGWIADTSTVQTVQVNTGETSTVTFTNKELPGLRILKYERNNMMAMEKVTFEVFRDNVSIGTFETDAMGEILIPNAQPGSYRVREVSTGDDSHIVVTTEQNIELKAGDGIRELTFFNVVKPGIHLVKVDASDPSKGIPNAVFEIRSVDGTFQAKEFTTDRNGEIDLSNLDPKAYVVVEQSCPGYVIDNAQRIIQLKANTTAEFVFTNRKLPSLTLTKYSALGGRLAGASFRLARIEDGTHYIDRTTDNQGEITWDALEPGVYSVQEMAAPAGYVLNSTEYHVELFPGKDSELVVINEAKPDLRIVKTDATTGAPVQGVKFTVKEADGHTITTEATDENGEVFLGDMDPGVVEIWEHSVPDNYLLNEEHQLITLTPNKLATVHFENYPKPGLTVNKLDSVTGDPIQGARFHVTYASNNTTSGEINDLGIFYSDKNGRFSLTNLRDGWYRVEETEPAAGYAIKEPAVQEVYVKGGESKLLTFKNTPLSALVVYKFDSVTGAAVEGATFQVKYLAGGSSTGGTVIGIYKTSVNGSFTVTGLKAGTYVVEELASDENHVIDTAPQTALISGKEQDVVQLYFGNAPKASLTVKKVDATTGKPLSDVEFMVTLADGSVVGDANGKFITDSSGSFTVSGLNPGTTLVVKETRAKVGYLLDDAPQTITVKAGQAASLEFRNQPCGALVIVKRDANTKKPLQDAEFKVTTSDGKYVDAQGGSVSSKGLYTTDKDGQIIITGLEPCTVVVTETKAPSGYVLDETPQTVAINANDTQTLYFYDKPTPTGDLKILKLDEESRQPIQGVEFSVSRINGERLGLYRTNSKGTIYLEDLEPGWYTVQETKAAKDYRLDAEPKDIEVKNGKTATLEVTNRLTGSALIHKVDSVTGKGIYGVTFLVSDAKGNPVGQYTSDQNGYVYVDGDLADGRYTIREIQQAEGYLSDTTVKTIWVEYGGCSTITWYNTPCTGQIQLTKTSADYNSINGWPAGTAIPGCEFEIYNKAGNLVDTIRTDKNGIATTKALPLDQYKVIESKSADFYALDTTPFYAELQFAGQIVRIATTNKSVSTGVAITKTGYKEVMPGQMERFTFTGIGNTSTVPLQDFYWRDTIPTDALRLSQVVTGTWNVPSSYKLVYLTNKSGGQYRTLADNVSAQKQYTIDASPVALGLAKDEYVTEVMAVFGIVPAGFHQVENPALDFTAVSWLQNGYQFTNQADVGGNYNGAWVQAITRWVTSVYAPTKPLPRTGY